MKKKIIIIIIFIMFFISSAIFFTKQGHKINKIAIDELPTKLVYYEGEEVNLDGLVLHAVYNNKKVDIIENYEIEYGELKVGFNTITIKYNGFTTNFNIEIKSNDIIEVILKQKPTKLVYFIGDEIIFDDLIVEVKYQNGKIEVCNDYEIEYDTLKIGTNQITIEYNGVTTTFDIEIKAKEKIKIIDYDDYSSKTIKNINFKNYDKTYNNVYYGKSRKTDMFIAFDEFSFVSTNIYGYEVSVNKHGMVIDKNTKVNLPEGGLVLSAHGASVKYVKEIEKGDFILYFNETVYVYKNTEISKYNEVFMLFYDYLECVKQIDDIDLYNEHALKINNLIPALNDFYKNYDLNTYNYLIKELNVDVEFGIESIHEHKYSYADIEFKELSSNDISSFNYELVKTYTDKLYIGGFRQADTLVYYDKDCYKSRNSYGYEVSVNKDGIVVDKDSLVELEDDGFILSGHSSTAQFIIDNIQLNDKIEIVDGKVYIYRDSIYMLRNSIINSRNSLVEAIKIDYDLDIPHDYIYLKEIIKEIDDNISYFNKDTTNLYKMLKISTMANVINQLIANGYSQLVEYDADLSRGIWYYPFNKPDFYDDTSKEGVIKTIETFKKAGINEVVIYVFANDRCLFDCEMYKKYDQLDKYDYGEYGNDYLKCFIEECHKRDILVNAFTQTFHGYVYAMKQPNNSYYQIDFNNELSLGSINYYDICNDDLQEEVINWYKELVTKYDFDKVEYDIIRYPSSNLYKYLDTDEVLTDSQITDHGYTEYSMDKFLKLYNLSGDLRTLIKTDKKVRKLWLEFKEQELVNFITDCTKAMKEINSDLVVTAAVMNNYESAKQTYLQDSKKWLYLKIVDEVEVMMYTPSQEEFKSDVDKFSDLYEEYSVRAGMSPRLDIRDIKMDLIQLLYASKNEGYVIFATSVYYDNAFFDILSKNHHYPYLNNLSSKEKVLEYEILDMIDMIEDYYSILNNENYEELITKIKNNDNYLDAINNLEDELMKNYLLNKLDYKKDN